MSTRDARFSAKDALAKIAKGEFVEKAKARAGPAAEVAPRIR